MMLKRIIDLMMIFLLPVLMAEILTGQEVHEWLGVGIGKRHNRWLQLHA